MNKYSFIAAAIMAVLLALISSIPADVPRLISFQGKLYDNTGNPLTGPKGVTFRIYGQQIGGTALWTETITVNCESGLYHVILGQISSITLDFNGQYWLGVQVSGDSELSPRYRLVSVPTAIRAQVANEVSWTNLTDVPAGFADGTDDVGSSGGGVSQINAGTGINVTNPTGPTVMVAANIGNGATQVAAGNHDHDSIYSPTTELKNDDGNAPNAGSNMVHWNNLWGVPIGFADGTDEVGAAGGVSQINAGTGIHVTDPTGPTATVAANIGTGADQVAAGNHKHAAEEITSGIIENARLNMGHGNGIDADKLDGKHATAFSDSAHQHDSRYYTETELQTDDGNGPNTGANFVHWNNLWGVPAGFADGTDEVGSAGGGVTQIDGGTGITVTNPTGPTATVAANFGTGATQVAAGNHTHHSLNAVDSHPTNAVYVDTEGHVGIGTTTPMEKLHVSEGDIRTDIGYGLVLTNEDNDVSNIYTWGDNLNIINFAAGDMWFSTGVTEGSADLRLLIKDDGNVGIGNANPAHKLDVGGTVQMAGFKMPPGASSGYVLTSDGSGVGTWQELSGGGSITSVNPGWGLTGGGSSGDVTISLASEISGSQSTPLLKIANNGDGYGLQGETAGNIGVGVVGAAKATGYYANYGGYFEAKGKYGRGIYAKATASDDVRNYGGEFEASGNSGIGVSAQATGDYGIGVEGKATGNGNFANYGGWFSAAGNDGFGIYGLATGATGRGVHGDATSTNSSTNYGGYFEAAGEYGVGVLGKAKATGNVDNYGGKFEAAGNSARAIDCSATATGNVTNYGGFFTANGNSGRAICAWAEATGDVENYGGEFHAKGNSGRGIKAVATATGDHTNYGGHFEAKGNTGRAVYGVANATGDVENYGGYFKSAGNNGFGVHGEVSGSSGIGVSGDAAATGPHTNYGGRFLARGDLGRGIYCEALATGAVENYGGYFKAGGNSGKGVYGEAQADGSVFNIGGDFKSNGDLGEAVRGKVTSTSSLAYAIHGVAEYSPAFAGYFDGAVMITDDLDITGTLSKGGGSFKIDHPLDPRNKYLSHSFVESPDMKNVYDGVVTLNSNGEAIVQLPEYFEALNGDFRYQLTAIGAPGPNLFIAQKISRNRFRIAGGSPGMEVSWQVTGIRKDAFANAHRIPVEEEKSSEERGTYLHPVEHGQPESSGIAYSRRLAKEVK